MATTAAQLSSTTGTLLFNAVRQSIVRMFVHVAVHVAVYVVVLVVVPSATAAAALDQCEGVHTLNF